MPPEAGAIFIWLLVAILWCCGWRDEERDISRWAVGFYLAIWPIAIWINFQAASVLAVNGAWLLTFAAMIYVAASMDPARRTTAISVGIFIGIVFMAASRLGLSPLWFSHPSAAWGAAILLGWLSALLIKPVPGQVLAIAVGLYLSQCLFAIVQINPVAEASPRTSEWLMYWWSAVLTARVWSISTAAIKGWFVKDLYRIGDKRGERS